MNLLHPLMTTASALIVSLSFLVMRNKYVKAKRFGAASVWSSEPCFFSFYLPVRSQKDDELRVKPVA